MEQTHFATAELDLAATILAAIDTRLLCVDRTLGDEPRFVFALDDVVEVVEAYWRGEVFVCPVIFAAAQRYLRSRLNDELHGESLPSGVHFPPFRKPD